MMESSPAPEIIFLHFSVFLEMFIFNPMSVEGLLYTGLYHDTILHHDTTLS